MSLAPFVHPLAFVATSFVAAIVVTSLLDRLAMPAKVRAGDCPPRQTIARSVDFLARIPLVALIFALFFAISWRPLYAFAGTASTFAIFTLISRAKFEYIREPLVFSDIALVTMVFRHKDMFYATWLNIAFWAAALTYVFGASALFMLFEPSILPEGGGATAVATMVLAAAAPWLLLFQRRVRQALSRRAAALIRKDDIKVLTNRLGTLAAVAYGFLAWLGNRPKPLAPVAAAARAEPATNAAGVMSKRKPLLVVWQSESFMDMRHFGATSLALPNLDRLRRRAVEWGRMSSIFEGGYTLRTEFSVISGLRPDQLGPDATHPYLKANIYGDIAWPSRLREAGWSTHFIHPYDRNFFSRDRALPLLGFERLSMLDAFDHDPEREGPYVSDLTLSKRVVDACRDERDDGCFLFAASMENHGPWQPGRHGDSKNPVDIYQAILERSDTALGLLADELDRMARPVWLAFYGDHAPVLKSFADPFPDPRTEYLIVPLAHAADARVAAVEPREKAPWDIILDMVRHAGISGLAAARDKAA